MNVRETAAFDPNLSAPPSNLVPAQSLTIVTTAGAAAPSEGAARAAGVFGRTEPEIIQLSRAVVF